MYNHFLNISQTWLHTEDKKPALVSGECLRLQLGLLVNSISPSVGGIWRLTVTSVGEITKTLTSPPLGEQFSQSGDLGRQDNEWLECCHSPDSGDSQQARSSCSPPKKPNGKIQQLRKEFV